MTVRLLWRELRRDAIVSTALAVALLLLLLAVFLPWLDGTDADAARVALRLEAPSWAGGDGGLLGTDQLGRDLWLRILHGLRTSYVVAVLAALLGAAIGTAIGLVAGYRGGRVDVVLMRVTDVQLAFPGLLLVMVVTGTLGRGVSVLVIALGLLSWTVYARVVRGAVLSLRTTDLVTASVAIGASTPRVLLRHVLPNVLPVIVAIGALEFARLMMAEASLSFLGFGVQPPQVSLGSTLAAGRDYLSNQWWIATFAGLFLALAVLSTNLVGNWLQRVGDPTRVVTVRARLRRRRRAV